MEAMGAVLKMYWENNKQVPVSYMKDFKTDL